MVLEYPIGVSGTLTRVLETGAGSSTAVFLHGLGARADRWRRNLEAIADAGYRCLALDLPGHGFASKTPDFDYSVPGFADFVLAILKALEVDRFHLIGTSLGGHVSGWIAAHHPGQVASLAMVGTLGLVPIGREAGAAIRDSVRATGRADIENKLKFVLHDPAEVTSGWIEEEYRINNSPGADGAFERLGDYIAEEVDQHNVGEKLAGLKERPPIMLVWGRQDGAVPPSVGEKGRALLGDVPLLMIDPAGHAPYFEQPGQFNGPVIDFLQQAG
ncbi:MAG TPA: alpha/beta fold hydrolase [Alphaproteobacteria bacterium]|nr:alpha/beta fold hydrolase [Alphaproteobacteria bacterium]